MIGLVSYNTVVLETGRLASIWPGYDYEIITFTVNVILFAMNKSLSYWHVVNSLIIWNCQKSLVDQKRFGLAEVYTSCAGPNDHQVTSTFVKLCRSWRCSLWPIFMKIWQMVYFGLTLERVPFDPPPPPHRTRIKRRYTSNIVWVRKELLPLPFLICNFIEICPLVLKISWKNLLNVTIIGRWPVNITIPSFWASPLHTNFYFSIWTFVSCVWGLLSPASLKMGARATLWGVTILLRISAYKIILV